MAESPVINTARLCIKPFSEGHLTARYTGWLSNKRLMRYSEQSEINHTYESCHAYMTSFIDTPNYFWAIEEMYQGYGHIGNINAYVDTLHKVADVGILIGEANARHKGYGLEAWEGVCRWLLEECGMRKVTAGTLAVNTPMLRIMEKSRMIPDGVRKRQKVIDGVEVDMVHMAIFFPEYPNAI